MPNPTWSKQATSKCKQEGTKEETYRLPSRTVYSCSCLFCCSSLTCCCWSSYAFSRTIDPNAPGLSSFHFFIRPLILLVPVLPSLTHLFIPSLSLPFPSLHLPTDASFDCPRTHKSIHLEPNNRKVLFRPNHGHCPFICLWHGCWTPLVAHQCRTVAIRLTRA